MPHFFTSDTHLGHANIIKYCKRPFLTEDELRMVDEGINFRISEETVRRHDTFILDAINDCVGVNDTLWVIGDFAWRTPGFYRSKIRCTDVRLIWGNHDDSKLDTRMFSGVYDIANLTLNHQPIVMCHYPMRSWHRSHHGSWHLFGHVHGNLADIPHHLALDVGVDTHAFKPWSWNEVATFMAPRIPLWKKERDGWRDKERGGMVPGTHG